MSLRIGFDGHALSAPAGGVRRYTRELFVAMKRVAAEVEITAVGVDGASPPGISGESVGFSLPTNLGWCASGVGRCFGASRTRRLLQRSPFSYGCEDPKAGATGPRFMVGRRLDKTGLGAGRLYLAVNDNGHWQNNIGSFRVKLRVSDAYDVSDPQ